MKLYRSSADRKIAGVCGGIAAAFGLDSAKVRWAAFFLVLFGGISFWLYLLAWFVLPLD